MKRLLLSCAVLSVLVLPAVAFSQDRTPPAGSTSAGTAVPRTGGNDTAVPRGGDTGSSSSSSPSSPSSTNSGSSGADWNSYSTPTRATTAPAGISRDVRSGDAPSYNRSRGEQRSTVGQPVPGDSRPRGDRPIRGFAVPRSSYTSPGTVPSGGFDTGDWGNWASLDSSYGNWWGYDWGWYSPYLFSMGTYYFGPLPYGYDAAQGGGVAPAYAQPANGAMKLKVTPNAAEVYVDMKYMGRVKEFDGALQHLAMAAGTHSIEIRSEGYETLRFEVRIMPGRTVTYQGTLRPAVK